jgi:serine protease Do
VTTLTGAKIEVGAIHGAIGRDLAILRIEGTPPSAFLTLSADPLQTAKIGDKVAVVGNRRGGGVATQVSGVVQGVGPDKVEVDAQFQPGNSGSPIMHVASGEVIGLAAYSQTRKLDVLDGVAAKSTTSGEDDEPKIEQRWFGYRIDGVSGWQAIDLARWRQQARRIETFRKDSEALYYALLGRFSRARQSPSVQSVVDRFQQRFERAGSGQVQAAQDVVEYFRNLRALTENGKKDLRDGDYYDYFRSSLYWETSITEQLRARDQIAEYLEQATDNSSAFLLRLRK